MAFLPTGFVMVAGSAAIAMPPLLASSVWYLCDRGRVIHSAARSGCLEPFGTTQRLPVEPTEYFGVGITNWPHLKSLMVDENEPRFQVPETYIGALPEVISSAASGSFMPVESLLM